MSYKIHQSTATRWCNYVKPTKTMFVFCGALDVWDCYIWEVANFQGPMAFWGHPGVIGCNYVVCFQLAIWYVGIWLASWAVKECHDETWWNWWNWWKTYTWSIISYASPHGKNDHGQSIWSLWLKHVETRLTICTRYDYYTKWMNPLGHMWFCFLNQVFPGIVNGCDLTQSNKKTCSKR